MILISQFKMLLSMCGFPQSGDQLRTSVVQPVDTFADLPEEPSGLFLVLADETKGGSPTIYLYSGAKRYWFAATEDT